ncbi:hypothetical protein DFH09DRAFT_899208 [Mycena vulgaris]|nr:hypothetical protein DFH09DRAFT_899208 [Mycena vulgaris]
MATTYSAWFATRKGPPSKVLQLKSLPIPTKLAKGDVLVKVQAIGLNPYVYKMMGGLPNFVAGRPLIVPERDLAGTVVSPNGTEFAAGDLVFGTTPAMNHGTMAEYVVLPAASLVALPPGVSPVEAAGLSVVALTVREALVAILKIQPGQTVFINGGSSAVGSSAIQIAKSMGCKVVATASARNKDFLLSLGVDEFIDYTLAPLPEKLTTRARTAPKFHGIFDAVGLSSPALYLNCTAYLAPGGTYVSAGGFPMTRKDLAGVLRQVFEGALRPAWLGGVPRKYAVVTCPLGKKDLEAVRELVVTGALKPIVNSVHSFDRAGVMAAYEHLATNRAVGKVVIEVRDGWDRDSDKA